MKSIKAGSVLLLLALVVLILRADVIFTFPDPTLNYDVIVSWTCYPGWNTNGTSFNIRQMYSTNDITNPMSWPVLTNVSRLLVTLPLVDPATFRCVTATNSVYGTESQLDISPVVEQWVAEIPLQQ